MVKIWWEKWKPTGSVVKQNIYRPEAKAWSILLIHEQYHLLKASFSSLKCMDWFPASDGKYPTVFNSQIFINISRGFYLFIYFVYFPYNFFSSHRSSCYVQMPCPIWILGETYSDIWRAGLVESHLQMWKCWNGTSWVYTLLSCQKIQKSANSPTGAVCFSTAPGIEGFFGLE